MYPVPIEHYHHPNSAKEASKIAAEATGVCFYIAGGMSLMQAIKSRMIAPDCIIDLNGVDELRGISNEGSEIRIGAMTRYREFENERDLPAPFNALSDAAAHVGDRQVRNRGTIGGSLSWNYVSACSPAAALACDANVEILRLNGAVETVGIDEFLVAPMTTALGERDLLTAIVLNSDSKHCGSAYAKWGIVTDSVPVVGVAVSVTLDNLGKTVSARFVIGGLDNGPTRSTDAEAMLANGIEGSDGAALKACADAAAAEISTTSDHKISADYKSLLISQLGTEMLEKAVRRARA